jgi:hypothetical protein
MLVAVVSDGRILYANRSIVGIDPIALRATNVCNFFPMSHQDLFTRVLDGVFTHNEFGGYEIADASDESDPKLHIIRFGPVMKDRKVVAATLLSLDVTDRVG